MIEWKEYKLGELCQRVTSGGTPNTRKNEYYGGEIPWVRTQEVNFNRIYDTEIKITKQGLENSSAKWIPENSVIIAMYGATAGKVAINKIPLTTNQACCNLITNELKADYRFVYYNILSRFSSIANMAVGGAQQNLNAGMIKDLNISTPPLPTQTAIAEILSSLDDKIELNNKINQELENLAQTLFKQWFIDFEFPNENGEPYKSSGGEMVESELGEIPKGWEIGTIDDITEVVTKGTTPTTIGGQFTESGINFIKVESLSEHGAFIKSKFGYIDEHTNQLLKRSILKDGDVLYSIAGTIGRVAVVTKDILPANTNQAIAILRPAGIDSNFLRLLMRSSLIQNEAKSNIVQAVQANLSLGAIKSTKFTRPSKDVLDSFNSALENCFKNKELITLEIEELTNLRDTLLPKLIAGELVVPSKKHSLITDNLKKVGIEL
jgi:type I restriction enzyme S subunit